MQEMKNNIKRLCMLLPLAATLLLPTGCKKEMTTFDILAIAEEGTPDSDGSKTRLVNETHVYWEDGDQINARYMGDGSATATPSNVGTFTFSVGSSDEESEKAIFTSVETGEKQITVPEAAKGNYLALFPANDANTLEEGNVIINFPAEQGYRNDRSFAKTACPMVAYGNDKSGQSGLVRMLFHNLAGLVRIQIIDSINNQSNSYAVHQLKSLSFSTTNDSPCKQLSGPFVVTGYKTNAPSLTATANVSKTVTITPSSAIDLPVHNNVGNVDNEPLTFYLVLPAMNGTGDNGYKITMTATAIEKGTSKQVQVVKTFVVNIRRNGITKMPALTVHEWSESGNGTVSPGITGNGTADRPFLIYKYQDLVQLRRACKHSLKINGKAIANGVHIRLMNYIELGTETTPWTEGIPNFSATLTYGGSQSSANQGIKNNTNVPIFESIATGGVVRGLNVSGHHQWSSNESDAKGFSPLCHTNNGTISDCMVDDNASFGYNYLGISTTVGVGGICVENNGTIQRCGCRGHLQSSKMGGICLYNHGTITQCFIPSPMRANVGTDESVEAGGICYSNEGTISDCYFAANINLSGTNWAGIAYINSGGSLTRCYVDASGIIQSKKSVGALVHTMTGGTVDKCWNDADLLQVDNSNVQPGQDAALGLGGLVYEMSGGTVRNCYRRRSSGSMTAKIGIMGGFVAKMSGGLIANCYVYSDMSQTVCNTKGIFVGSLTGGTIENCYGEQTAILGSPTPFYGSKSGSPALNDCYSKVEQAGVTVYDSHAELLNGRQNQDETYIFPGLTNHSWPDGTRSYYLGWVAGPNGEPAQHSSSTSTKRKAKR